MSDEKKSYELTEETKKCFSNFTTTLDENVSLKINIKDLPLDLIELDKETINVFISSIIGSFKNRILYLKKTFLNDKHLNAFEIEMKSILTQCLTSLNSTTGRENVELSVSEVNSNLVLKINRGY